jgi:hypothetical protein
MCLEIGQLGCGHVSQFNYFCVFKIKIIGLILIIKVSTIKIMTRGTPWNVHEPFDTCPIFKTPIK